MNILRVTYIFFAARVTRLTSDAQHIKTTYDTTLVSAREQPAIDAKHGAVDVRARLAHEHEHRANELLRLSPAPQRHLGCDTRLDLLAQREARHVREEGTWADAVDRDAVRTELERAGMADANLRKLARRIARAAFATAEAADG